MKCFAVDVWILAAKHELEFRHSMHGARTLLQQAIASNPDSQQLWLEVGHVDYDHLEITSTQVIFVKSLVL